MIRDLIGLAVLFLGTGLLALVYYRAVPPSDDLRRRLPNRPGLDGVLLTLLLAGAIWYLVSIIPGRPITKTFAFVFSLLVFESLFLLALRWIRSTLWAILPSLALAGLGFAASLTRPSAFLLNTLIILATFGATTLLIRLGYLRTRFLGLVAVLWTIYDVLLVSTILPKVLVPATRPQPSFLFPAVAVGGVTLGSGDFIFLVLFTLIALRDLGLGSAMIMAVTQSLGLLLAGLLLPTLSRPFPFLIVMTPLFFIVYALLQKKNPKSQTNSSPPQKLCVM